MYKQTSISSFRNSRSILKLKSQRLATHKQTSISSFRNLRSILKLASLCVGWVGQKMPHRSRDLKSKTKSLRLNFGTWRRTDLKKNQQSDDEEQRNNKSEWVIGWSERFDNEKLSNDLTTKNRDKEQRKNRSEWAIGRSDSNLKELKRSWGRRSEIRVFKTQLLKVKLKF